MASEPIEISVRSDFRDGRVVTLTCLSYHPYIPVEFLTLKSGIQPRETWTIMKHDAGTVQKCHMVRSHRDGDFIRSKFEVFIGSHNHDHPGNKNPSTQKIRLDWLVNDDGLLLYSFIINGYYVVKPFWSIQYIGVEVWNRLGKRISVLCLSEESSGQSEITALDSRSHGEGVHWIIRDFNPKTTQVCRVDFDNGAKFVFEAFHGSWNRDYSIRDTDTGSPKYRWILRDNSLHRYNYSARSEMFINYF